MVSKFHCHQTEKKEQEVEKEEEDFILVLHLENTIVE